MALLFIDSTYDITLGLLDDNLRWIDFKRLTGQKASKIIQLEVFEMCQRARIKTQDLKSVVTIAGPGFYTGLRVSEGFADVLSFFNISHYSFLSYHIPKYLGVKAGTWFTKAYRGEYFFHHWNENTSTTELIDAKDLESYLSKFSSEIYVHSDQALDAISMELLPNRISCHDLIHEEPENVFFKVISMKKKEESFYFRAPEDEFRTSGK